MIGNLGAFFTKCLQLSIEWQVISVVINDEQTKVDLRVSMKKTTTIVYHECGCQCRWHDTRERAWRHTKLFDMECVINSAVPRCRCPSCGRTFVVEVP